MKIKKTFTSDILKWYRKSKRDLPWRRTRDPYKIWVSEIMLQQTTVNAVIPYFEKWIKTYPTVHKLAKSPIQKVLKQWQGLGYYNRARNLHKSAQIVSKEFKGRLPQERSELKKLPGFGDYTVGAVLSIAFDKPEPIVDANVRRVFMRLLRIEGKSSPKLDSGITEELLHLLPKKGSGDFNQGLMELGALICRSKEPLCSMCPVRKHCLAYKDSVQELIPLIKVKSIINIDAAIGVIKNKGKFLIQKRSSKGLLADLWEFPGGKIEKGESPKKAIFREVKEELGVDVKKSKHLFNVVHYYTKYKVKLHVSLCEIDSVPATNQDRKWVSLKDMGNYPMPSGSAKIVDRLKEGVNN